MEKLENQFRILSRKILEVSHLNYWERLTKLKMYSQERRMERYRAIYVWKILEGISPNCGIEESFSDRRGREVKVPFIRGKSPVQAIREKSFQVHGAKLFNAIPKSIRNLRKISIEDFKFKLDKFLEGIPDEPKLPGYVPRSCNQISAVPSNSIIDQSRTASLDSRRPG